MDLGNLISKITSVAPLLGTLVAGPAGGAAGTAIKLIAGALGVEATPQAIEEQLSSNPDALLKLKQLEADHETDLRKLVLEAERIRLADVSDARGRQIAHEKATGKVDIFIYILAWLIVVGFFGLMGLLCFHALPKGSNEAVFLLFGSLAAGFGQVLTFFYGSSKGSQSKDAMISKGANQ